LIPPAHLKEQIEAVGEERMKICNGCSYNSENRKKTGKFTSSRPDVHCTSCGCTLSAKTVCLSCSCPLEKWGAVISGEEEEQITKEFEEDGE
jgi:hypothetical protein